MDYRREIDGLRSLAVVPVIFFHAGFEVFSGGYVGVDIFFVISGYLITMTILDDLERGKFSIINFSEACKTYIARIVACNVCMHPIRLVFVFACGYKKFFSKSGCRFHIFIQYFILDGEWLFR